MKRVSIVVLTWNSEKFIEECLASVCSQTYPSIETIVVDNASQDSTVRKIRERFPSLTLIENRENLGYCRANNSAFKRANGDYLLCLNSDVILGKDFIEKAVRGFQKDGRIGMVSGKILRFDKRTIDSTGQYLAKSRKTIERGYGMMDDGRFDSEGYVFSVCGAASFYRKRMIEEISYGDGEFFDEDFFSFHEDIDVGWRGNLFGWKAYYIPDAVAYHYRGGTAKNPKGGGSYQISGRSSLIKYHIVKNRYLSIIKNDTLRSYLNDFPFIVSRDILILVYIVLTAPNVLVHLFQNRVLFRRAFKRRALSHRTRITPEGSI